MPDDDKELDAQIAAMTGTDGAPPTEGTPATTETPASEPTPGQETQAIEIAGRKYKDQAEANRAHDHLYRHSTKLQNELKTLREQYAPWTKFMDAWQKDPQFREHFIKAEQDYLALRKAGVPKEEAKARSGVAEIPAEVKEKLEAVDEILFEREETKFKTGHPEVTAEQMDKIYAHMREVGENEGVDISIERAWKEVRIAELDSDNKKKSEELRRLKAGANVGSPSNAPAQPKPKTTEEAVRGASDADYDKLLDQGLRTHGLV